MLRLRLRPGVRWGAALGLWAAVCATPACRRQQPPPPVRLLPVTGKVTIDGRPLALEDGSVVFWPDPARGNPSKEPATGTIYGAGKFTLFTEAGQKGGAAPGWYKVVVFPFPLASGERVPKRAPEELPDSPVPAPYMDVDTTPLSVEVTESPAEDAYHLRLTR